MSGSDPKEKQKRAPIWLLGIGVGAIVGAAIQGKPITIAASDNPAENFNAGTGERRKPNVNLAKNKIKIAAAVCTTGYADLAGGVYLNKRCWLS